jgi:Mg-chelatase subunit ChlD
MRYAFVLVLGVVAVAQDGTTDGSVGRSSVLLASGRLPKPEEVHVYDFINYHTHALQEPAKDESVALDARLLRPSLPAGDTETVLQIGFRTHRMSLKDVKPVNLALVIDKSGSMAGGGKLEYVKQAMEMFLSAFDEDDRLAVIVYDTNASVLRASDLVRDRDAILKQIREVQPGSSTNLHGGLMLGLEEVKRHFDPKRANRVILLSDGLANQGKTDTEEIIRDAKPFTDAGIDVTTVGIGLDYNNALMRGLADAGRGTYHFLDSGREIERVFGTFLQSLLEKVARRPRVSVTLANGVGLKQVHGYEYAVHGARALSFELIDMPLALTQVIPIELTVAAGATSIGTVRFEYRDERAGKDVTVERGVALARGDAITDADVMKNVTIARLATAVRAACEKPETGRDALQDALKRCETVYDKEPKDADVKRVVELARGALAIVQGPVKE